MGPETNDVQAKERRDRRVTQRATFVALALFVVLLVWLLSQFGRVPDVRGLSTEGARVLIEDAGFVMGAVIEQPSTEPDGAVFEQSHEPNRLALKGNEISVTISLGAVGEVETESEIVEAAREEDMEWELLFPEGERVVIPDDRPEYEPQYIDYGPAIPSIQGLSEASAVSILRAAGYGVEVSFDYSTTGVPAGTVMYQDPPPDVHLDEGTVVDIVISTGPPVRD